MRNRAKCKLCESIIESFHRTDLVSCKCGEISIDGGSDYMKCAAKNWINFLRIDETGKVLEITVVDPYEEKAKEDVAPPPSRKELIEMLDVMVKNIENLPKHAMDAAINHYDLYSFVLLISSILKTKESE